MKFVLGLLVGTQAIVFLNKETLKSKAFSNQNDLDETMKSLKDSETQLNMKLAPVVDEPKPIGTLLGLKNPIYLSEEDEDAEMTNSSLAESEAEANQVKRLQEEARL